MEKKTVVIEEDIFIPADGAPQETSQTPRQPPTKKKLPPLPLILLLTIIGMWIAVLAFDSDSPKQAVEKLFDHMNAAEYEQGKQYFAEEMGWEVPNVDVGLKLTILQISEKRDGDTAEVFVEFEEDYEGSSSPMHQEVTFLLRKDSEVDWVIYDIVEP